MSTKSFIQNRNLKVNFVPPQGGLPVKAYKSLIDRISDYLYNLDLGNDVPETINDIRFAVNGANKNATYHFNVTLNTGTGEATVGYFGEFQTPEEALAVTAVKLTFDQ